MSQNPTTLVNTSTTLLNMTAPENEISEELFDQIIERLKIQKALPRDAFTKEMPFFNFSSLTKEAQIKELFQDASDPNFYKSLIKNMVSTEEKNTEFLAKKISVMQVMSFAQIMLYKIFPCHEPNCSNRPREIATHNQYKDYEYECPFYHHEKDRRRLVITPVIDEEFTYKANYFEENKRGASDKDKHSQNYFESMFHPLYYKMFRCKRDYCNFSSCCPFYHSEEEKKIWDRVFSNFIRKDRISYVKDKQKYYEQNSHNQTNSSNSRPTERRIFRSGSDDQGKVSNSNPESPNFEKTRGQNGWRSDRALNHQQGSNKKWNNNKRRNYDSSRQKESEMMNGNSSSGGFAYFYECKQSRTNRVC